MLRYACVVTGLALLLAMNGLLAINVAVRGEEVLPVPPPGNAGPVSAERTFSQTPPGSDSSGAQRFLAEPSDTVTLYGERRFGAFYEPAPEPPATDPDTGYPINWIGFASYPLFGGLYYAPRYYGAGAYRAAYRPWYVPYGYGYGWGYRYPFSNYAPYSPPNHYRYRYAGPYAPAYTYRPYLPYSPYAAAPNVIIEAAPDFGGGFSW